MNNMSFRLRAALHQGLPSLCRKALKPSPTQRTTLVVCSIFPDLARLWWFYASKVLSHRLVRSVIVDRHGGLDPGMVPGAIVIPFPNFMQHAQVVDQFIRLASTPYYFQCDDDDFLLDSSVEPYAVEQLQQSRCAVVTYHPRFYGDRMGLMCLLFRRDVLLRENIFLSFRPRPAQEELPNAQTIKDQGDQADAELKSKGYTIHIVDNGVRDQDSEVRNDKVCWFRGLSTAVTLAREFGAEKLLQELCLRPANSPHYFYWWMGILGWSSVTRLYEQAFGVAPQEPCPLSRENLEQILIAKRGELSGDILEGEWQVNERRYAILARQQTRMIQDHS